MMTRIANEYRWEMGHRLVFHEGLCKNIHGHSYSLRIQLEGEVDQNGMILDFYDLSTIVEPIIDELDHSFLCDEGDSVMIEFFLNNPMKVVVVPFVTTAENICSWILERIVEKLKQNPRISSVSARLNETERAWAERTIVLR